MLAGMILGAALVVGLLMLFGGGRALLQGDRALISFSALGLGLAAIIAAVVFVQTRAVSDSGAQQFSIGLSGSEVARGLSSLRSSEPAATAGMSVASVPSLIDGLKSRLAADPGDASGWALLAQSYAFTGDDEQAEAALMHAVELGLDEADLRQRVEGARRDPHDGLAMTVR